MKILLVEDDPLTAAVLYEVFAEQYYTVELATDGENGLALATSSNFDLILLDMLIPKLDGISLCRQLRAQGVQKPILLLTAKYQSADIVKGLDAGADDYVIKPYDQSELLARMRALLRRGQTELVPAVLTWGSLWVNPVSAEVAYKGQPIYLTPKEYSLLGLFLRNPQRVFSRSDIINRLWSIDATPSEGTVTNLIKDLRQKLKGAGMSADLLETVYGLGYRLKTPPNEAKSVLPARQGQQTQRLEKRGGVKLSTTLVSINKLVEHYKDTFAQRVILLEQVEQALWGGKLQGELRHRGSNEAHKLAGTLGSFGYEMGSKLAQRIEHLLMGDKPLAAKEASQLSKLVSELKEALSIAPTLLTAEQLEPTKRQGEGGRGQGEMTPTKSCEIPLVLAIDDQSFSNQLKTEAKSWGVRLEVALNWAIAKQYISQSPKAVLLNFNGQEPIKKNLILLQQLKEQLPFTPILIMVEQDNLTERVAVSRLGVQRFLPKPITTAEIFEALAQVLPQSQAPQAKVMILDDDSIALELLSNLLQPWGLRVKTLQDPQQFWEVLIATTPDLLMIDLEMPTFSGIDLCRVVRQDPNWGNLPIMVVTAHTDLESIQQVLAAGADDFIAKPVVGTDLVTRVISRIDRWRLQQ